MYNDMRSVLSRNNFNKKVQLNKIDNNVLESKNLNFAINDQFCKKDLIIPKQKNQIAFTGRGLNLVEAIVKIFKREEESIKGLIKAEAEQGINAARELIPLRENPILTGTIYDDRAKTTAGELKKIGIDASKDTRNPISGGMHDYDQNKHIEEARKQLAQKKISQEQYNHLKNQISSCGNNDPSEAAEHARSVAKNIDIDASNKDVIEHSIEIKADTSRSIASAGQHAGSIKEQSEAFFGSSSDKLGTKADLVSAKAEAFGFKADLAGAAGTKSDALEGLSHISDHHDLLNESMSGISDVLGTFESLPVVETVAELLPGTKFFQPFGHLMEGELDKTLVTGGTRAIELLIAPFKLAFVGGSTIGGALGEAINKLMGVEDASIKKGAKEGYKMWNNGRVTAENFILGIDKGKELEIQKNKGYVQNQQISLKQQEIEIALFKKLIELAKKHEIEQSKVVNLERTLEYVEKIQKIQAERVANKKNRKGFNQIAWYEAEKIELSDKFITLLDREKVGEKVAIPNGIFVYGPTGTGKTSFAKALSEEAGCHFEELKGRGKTKEEYEQNYWNNLMEIAKNAKQKKSRTIILIDEIGKIANSKSSILADLENFLKDCSEKYNCTVFATTNNPLKIPESMRDTQKFSIRMPIGPADRKGIVPILKYYLEGKESQKLNHENLSFVLARKLPDSAYSNAQIEAIANRCNEEISLQRLFSEQDLIGYINRTTPAISKEDLNKFENEKRVIGK